MSFSHSPDKSNAAGTEPCSGLRVLQITDPHLMADPAGELLGVNTRDSLDAVIALIQAEEGEPDVVVVSGDIAQDGSEAAYRAFQDRMTAFSCPVIWFAGNHDNVEVMQGVIGGTGAARKRLVLGGWQLIFLDSSVPGKVHGELTPSELAFLEASLSEHPDLPALIALHHHPVDIDCDWMSDIGLRNRDELMQIVSQQGQVRGVLWGHIHQQWESCQGNVRLMATPSTCIQFAPESSGFSVDGLAPGYRWLELFADGDIASHVRRATDFEFSIDMNSQGY